MTLVCHGSKEALVITRLISFSAFEIVDVRNGSVRQYRLVFFFSWFQSPSTLFTFFFFFALYGVTDTNRLLLCLTFLPGLP